MARRVEEREKKKEEKGWRAKKGSYQKNSTPIFIYKTHDRFRPDFFLVVPRADVAEMTSSMKVFNLTR